MFVVYVVVQGFQMVLVIVQVKYSIVNMFVVVLLYMMFVVYAVVMVFQMVIVIV
jgi:hypothetical protein